jgi:hypothetical protein
MSTHPDSQIVESQRAIMNAIAEALDEMFNRGTKGNDRKIGFVLLTFPFSPPGTIQPTDEQRCNYISNGANRKDMACLMREMAARFEGQPETKPGRA